MLRGLGLQELPPPGTGCTMASGLTHWQRRHLAAQLRHALRHALRVGEFEHVCAPPRDQDCVRAQAWGRPMGCQAAQRPEAGSPGQSDLAESGAMIKYVIK